MHRPPGSARDLHLGTKRDDVFLKKRSHSDLSALKRPGTNRTCLRHIGAQTVQQTDDIAARQRSGKLEQCPTLTIYLEKQRISGEEGRGRLVREDRVVQTIGAL